jgi:hypothetical protein
MQLRVPGGNLSYLLELSSEQPNVMTPYHICLGSPSGQFACPSVSQQTAPVPPAPQQTGNVIDFTLPATYGAVTLNGGFLPDPFVTQVTSGGDVNVSYLGNGCTGWAAEAPDFSLTYNTPGQFLRFSFVGNGDTTMIVNRPDGTYVCNDDGGGNLNPQIDFSSPASGRYDIWIGSYSQGANISGTLNITERTSVAQVPPQQPQTRIDFSLPPNFGTTTLNAGFMPDPFTQQIQSGGNVDVSYLGANCRGWATSAPDFSVNYTSGAFSTLRFSFIGNGDTTMVINGPGADYVCDDDSHGNLNLSIDFSPPESGRYDIWIGSYAQGSIISGTLNVTEVTGTAQTQPQQPTTRLDFSLPPTYGATSLNAGFMPDPFIRLMTSGGNVNVSYLGGSCTGWATSAPDFSLNYTTGAFPTLRFYFVGNGDTTMIINAPDGTYTCVDDSSGTLNPTINFNEPASGRYDIWIGSYAQGSMTPGTLYVTESMSNHP